METTFQGFTEGDWTINPAETAYESVGILEPFKDRPGFKFYEIARIEWNNHTTLQQRRANAELIASAPALLRERNSLKEEVERLRKLLNEATL